MFVFTEKLEVVKMRAVKVCTKTGILSSQEFKIWSFVKNCEETASENGKSRQFRQILVISLGLTGLNYGLYPLKWEIPDELSQELFNEKH